MDDFNFVFDFVRGERLNIFEELKEYELNLRKTIENLFMDEDFSDLLVVLINGYFFFENNVAKVFVNIDDLEEKVKKFFFGC